MVTVRFPFKVASKVGAVYAKRSPLPSFMKLLHVLVRPDGELKIYALYEVEKGKEAEGYKALGSRFIPNFEIEGYKFETEWLLTIEEAFPMLGLASP